MTERVGVIGLGYVGLPVALAFGRRFPGTVGFDIKGGRVAALREGHDETGEAAQADLLETDVRFTADPADLAGCSLFIVTVPTPLDANRQPELSPLRRACETVGEVMPSGALVVFESTVYPGVTEEVCGPILAGTSGLRQGVDFKLGYSPERINPGDGEHTLTRIEKVVAGEDPEAAERVAAAYGQVIQAGVHRAPDIPTAEAAKVIENTQRDLNIALMNELALIFDRLGIRTKDVLAAAGTKWNFLPFTPGLVGGHCIGVDPYYLTSKAEAVGYHPQVILAGRHINDGMGEYVAQRTVKLLIQAERKVKKARVGVLGLTFKENVPDIRNSRVPDIVAELAQFGVSALVHDPLADPDEAFREYGIELLDWDELSDLDALILAVPHRSFLDLDRPRLLEKLVPEGVLVDIRSALEPASLPESQSYWSL